MYSSMPFAENNQLPQFIQEYAALLRNRIVAINETMEKAQTAVIASFSIEVPAGAELVVDDSNTTAQLLCRVRLPRSTDDSQTGTVVWDVTLEMAEKVARSAADMQRISAINTIIPHLVNFFAAQPELLAGAYQDTSGLRIVFTPVDFPQQVGDLLAVPRTSFAKSPDDNNNCWGVITDGRQIDTGYLPIYKSFYYDETTAGAWSFLLDFPRMIATDVITDATDDYQCHIVDEHNQLLGYQYFSATQEGEEIVPGKVRASLPLIPATISLQVLTNTDFADCIAEIEEEIVPRRELLTPPATNFLALLKLLFPSLRNAAWLLNKAGMIINVNPRFAAQLGYLPVEMIGSSRRNFLAASFLAAPEIALSDIPQVAARNICFCDSQGNSLYFAVEITAFSQGEVWLAHQLPRNVLPERAKNAAAVPTMQKIPLPAAGSGDDLPLVLNETTSNEDMLPQVLYKGERLQRFMTTLLKIVRLEAGKLPLEKRKFDIHPLLLDCVATQQTIFSEKALLLQADICKAPLQIMGDSKCLVQIVEQLLENALRFTEKGSVTLTVRRDVNMLHLVVADTGAGVAAEMCERVFDNFAQDNANSAGDGLGLALVRQLVLAHGGEVWLASSGPGRGCTVSIRLPLLPVMAAASVASAA